MFLHVRLAPLTVHLFRRPDLGLTNINVNKATVLSETKLIHVTIYNGCYDCNRAIVYNSIALAYSGVAKPGPTRRQRPLNIIGLVPSLVVELVP